MTVPKFAPATSLPAANEPYKTGTERPPPATSAEEGLGALVDLLTTLWVEEDSSRAQGPGPGSPLTGVIPGARHVA